MRLPGSRSPFKSTSVLARTLDRLLLHRLVGAVHQLATVSSGFQVSRALYFTPSTSTMALFFRELNRRLRLLPIVGDHAQGLAVVAGGPPGFRPSSRLFPAGCGCGRQSAGGCPSPSPAGPGCGWAPLLVHAQMAQQHNPRRRRPQLVHLLLGYLVQGLPLEVNARTLSVGLGHGFRGGEAKETPTFMPFGISKTLLAAKQPPRSGGPRCWRIRMGNPACPASCFQVVQAPVKLVVAPGHGVIARRHHELDGGFACSGSPGAYPGWRRRRPATARCPPPASGPSCTGRWPQPSSFPPGPPRRGRGRRWCQNHQLALGSLRHADCHQPQQQRQRH